MRLSNRTEAYSAGNKVYGFGRSNATSGPVDPIGYRERDMQSAVQRKLQTLSSIRHSLAPAPKTIAPAPTTAVPKTMPGAASAPVAKTMPGYASPSVPKIAPSATPTGTIGTAVAPMHTATPAPQNTGIVPSGYINPAGPPGQQAGGIPVTQAQPDQANHIATPTGLGQPVNTGGLQGAVTPEAGNPNLSNMTDVDYDNQEAQLAQAKAQAEADYQAQQSQAEQAWYQAKRSLQQQQPLDEQNTLENFAGRGMAHSGRYIHDLGALDNQYADQASQLDQSKNDQLNQLLASLTGARQGYESSHAANLHGLTQRLAAQAGKLGLDTTTQNPSAPNYHADQVGKGNASVVDPTSAGYLPGNASNAPGHAPNVTPVSTVPFAKPMTKKREVVAERRASGIAKPSVAPAPAKTNKYISAIERRRAQAKTKAK